ncbi:hypothetical protein N7486_005411 [Penicillium sp. IBT 16267x]|nr:hypothetical protein N7486_005411 [Penicillium sp. IBT 16267x]
MEKPIDEETLPHYDPEQFYPVHIGDVFDGRYRVTGKLGFGAYSTSWLCRDLQSQRHAVLKVSTSLRKFPSATDREFEIYEHLAKIKSTHPGQPLIRELYDSFELQGHLKTDNLMLSLEDSTMLADFAAEELRQPNPRKRIDESRTIYQSRQFRRPFKGKSFEIIFEMAWGNAVDIWNLGSLKIRFGISSKDIICLGKYIFDKHGKHDPFKHLALIVALIGPPPVDFVRRSETTGQCFDHTGAWIAHEDAAVPSTSPRKSREPTFRN